MQINSHYPHARADWFRKSPKSFVQSARTKKKRSRALTQLRLAIHTPAHLPPTIKRTADGRYYRANHGKNFTSLPRHILTHRAERFSCKTAPKKPRKIRLNIEELTPVFNASPSAARVAVSFAPLIAKSYVFSASRARSIAQIGTFSPQTEPPERGLQSIAILQLLLCESDDTAPNALQKLHETHAYQIT